MSADFSRSVIETLAKRAGNICSNPDCGAMTSGPAQDEGRSVNVGEAAHIYGARTLAARFDDQMSDPERALLSNAIWLCRNCHKAIDADEDRYPAELLFEWRRAHESEVAANLGKAGALLRMKVQAKRLEHFEDCSYLAQQIILDKPAHWEFLLTAELLRYFLDPVRLRWEDLKNSLYALPLTILKYDEYLGWHSAQIRMLNEQGRALSGILNGEIQNAWGQPGQPGSEAAIVRVSRLIREAAERMLAWEERVRFIAAPEEFEPAAEALPGIAGLNLEKIFTIAEWLVSVTQNPSEVHNYIIKFEWPDQWNDNHAKALDKSLEIMKARRQ